MNALRSIPRAARRTLALAAGLLTVGTAGHAQPSAGRTVRPTASSTARTGARPVARPVANTSVAGKPAAKAAKPATVASKHPITTRAAAPVTGRDAGPMLVASGEVMAADSAPSMNVPVLDSAVEVRSSHYRSTRDSLAAQSALAAAGRARGLRLVVSLEDRELHVLDGDDTLLVAPVAIGMDTTIRYGKKSWTFETPRGRRTVLSKMENPVWIPPEWHYAEVASTRGMTIAHMPEKGSLPIGGGRKLTVRGGLAGVIMPDGHFEALPIDEEIVFGNTLYIPPSNSENRKIPGELGRFRLDLGDGYQMHGTPHEDTIGDAATHGCIRLYDEDIEWLFQHVPVGTAVYIY